MCFYLSMLFYCEATMFSGAHMKASRKGGVAIAKANKYLKIFKHCIENEIIHVIAIDEEKFSTRHINYRKIF